MKLRKAYDALTDETARYNWEHYGNPDGPQAMQFGIGLPAWIVEERNSVFVLGVYALIFMIGLPTGVWYWWSRSSRFSSEQVLLDTTQLYYYFYHKTPHMMLRRVMMVLAASLEFERGHNYEIVERPTDNAEIPQLIKCLPTLGINNKEKPLCFSYSLKTRALIFAHLSRIPLPKHTLHQDRLYVIKKCPFPHPRDGAVHQSADSAGPRGADCSSSLPGYGGGHHALLRARCSGAFLLLQLIFLCRGVIGITYCLV
jgi:translocation protein SEC63